MSNVFTDLWAGWTNFVREIVGRPPIRTDLKGKTKLSNKKRLNRELKQLKEPPRRTNLAIREEREKLVGGSDELGRSEEANRAIKDALEKAQNAEDTARHADAARLQTIQAEAAAREPLQEIDRQLNELKGEAKALSEVLSVDETGLWPPVIDALDVQAGYEIALGAAIGDDLNVPMDEAAPAHWDLLSGILAGAQPLPAGAQTR